jgi:hypothetical protein
MGSSRPDPFEDLPDDPQEAFLVLEDHFRRERDRLLGEDEDDIDTATIQVEYISQVLGAVTALGLESEFKSGVQRIGDLTYATVLDFAKDLTHYRTVLQIRRSRRDQGYSVQFDSAAKRKVHHHLDQILEIFNKLEIEDTKRDKLISRLNDLQSEVNQQRTRFDRYAALTIEVSSVIGDAIVKSKVLDILDSVGRVIWGAQTERQKQLPPPKQPKSIEPPKPKTDGALPKPKTKLRTASDVDDATGAPGAKSVQTNEIPPKSDAKSVR